MLAFVPRLSVWRYNCYKWGFQPFLKIRLLSNWFNMPHVIISKLIVYGMIVEVSILKILPPSYIGEQAKT